MSKLKARSYREGDEIDIVKVYNIVTKNNKTVEQHRWQWLQTPHGQGQIHIIEDQEKQNKLVGHHGLIPISLYCMGETKLLGKTENTFLHPDYLGSGTYYFHEMRFYKEYKNKFDFLLTTSGHGAPGKMREKLGYRKLGRHINYSKLLNSEGLEKLSKFYTKSKKLPAFLTIFIQLVLMFKYFSKFSKTTVNLRKFQVQKEEINEINLKSLEELWEKIKKQFQITILRTSQYLDWRINKNPGIDYHLITVKQKGELKGYLIYQISKSEMPCVIIEDLIVEKNSQELFDHLIYGLSEEIKKKEISYAFFPQIESDNILHSLIQKNGFTINTGENSKNSHVLMKSHLDDQSIYDSQNWYYTELFKEGF